MTYHVNGDIIGVRTFSTKGGLVNSYLISYDYTQNKQFIYLEKEGKANALIQEVTYHNKMPIRVSGFVTDKTDMPQSYYSYAIRIPNAIVKFYYDDAGLLSIASAYLDNKLNMFIKYFYTK